MVSELEPMLDVLPNHSASINGHALTASEPDSGHTASPALPARKRRRPALSCIECRRRKVKCDRNFPCNHCVSSKHVSCTYDESAGILRESRVSPSFSASPIVDSRQAGAIEIPGPIIPGPYTTIQIPNTSYGTPNAVVDGSNSAQQNVRELTDRVHKLEHLLHESMRSQGNLTTNSRTAPHMRGSMSKARLFGQSHWMSLFEHVCLFLTLILLY